MMTEAPTIVTTKELAAHLHIGVQRIQLLARRNVLKPIAALGLKPMKFDLDASVKAVMTVGSLKSESVKSRAAKGRPSKAMRARRKLWQS